MKITILYSLPTKRSLVSEFVEADIDTTGSAVEVQQALLSKGYSVEMLPIGEDNLEDINKIKSDLIFNLIEWTGLDMPLAVKAYGLFENLKIPYTGATLDGYLLSGDKAKLKQRFIELNLPTAKFQVFNSGDEVVRTDFNYPVILKPSLEHCSIGLSDQAIAKNSDEVKLKVKKELMQFQQPILVEEFIDGAEFQVTIIEEKNKLIVLPPTEIYFDTSGTNAFLTYAGRWDINHGDYKISHLRVPNLKPELLDKINKISLETFEKLCFRDYARLDIRIRDDNIYILEANSNPGLGDDDEYGMTVSYKAAGLTFADFIEMIVQSASRSQG